MHHIIFYVIFLVIPEQEMGHMGSAKGIAVVTSPKTISSIGVITPFYVWNSGILFETKTITRTNDFYINQICQHMIIFLFYYMLHFPKRLTSVTNYFLRFAVDLSYSPEQPLCGSSHNFHVHTRHVPPASFYHLPVHTFCKVVLG